MGKVTVTVKKKDKYEDGSKSVKKKKDVYNREVTTTKQLTPGSKGKLYMKEGTVQRKSPTGVGFVPDSDKSIRNSNDKIVDPKSRKTENDGQAMLRKATVDSHKGVELENRYKEGDYVTYDTKKGKQVAGQINKNPDVKPTYQTTTSKQVLVSKKGGAVPYLKGTKEQQEKQSADLLSKGYKKQAGTEAYIKEDENKWVDESEAGSEANKSEGYFKSERAKKQLQTNAPLTKKLKITKKYKDNSKN